MLTLAFTGDVMLGRLVNDRLKTMQPEEVWGDVLPHLAQADLRIINLECALTHHLQPWTRTEKMFHFRADPDAVRVLQAARGEEFEAITARMEMLSAEFGTMLMHRDDRLVYEACP